MSNLRLRPLLIALVVIPCVVASLLALEWARERRGSSEQARALERMAELAVVIGDLLHETQRERGASSVFLSSKGAKFAEQVKTQRASTDKVRLRFVEVLEDQRSYWPSHVVATLELANSSLRDIESRRREVSAMEITPAEEMAYYTELNERLLDSIGSLVANTADVSLRGTATAYLYFLHAKEKTGLERAQLSNVFGTDAFAGGQLAVVAGLVASQTAYLNVFAKLAPPVLLASYEALLNDPAVAEVRRMEQVAMGRATGFGIDSGAWFTTMTKKIDLLKKVEDLLSAAVRDGARSVRDDARVSLIAAAALALLMIGAGLAGTLALAAAILRPLSQLRVAVERVTEGDAGVALMPSGPLELRQLGEAFRRMVDSLNQFRAPSRGHGSLTRSVGSRFPTRP
jgi:methyl-accepting chemotaxis protein